MFLLDSTLWWFQCRTIYEDQGVLFSCIGTGNNTGKHEFTTFSKVKQSSKHQITCHPGWPWKHLHWQTHTSWTTKFRKGPRAPPASGCTRSCCCRTGPPRSPSDGSHCGRKTWCKGVSKEVLHGKLVQNCVCEALRQVGLPGVGN